MSILTNSFFDKVLIKKEISNCDYASMDYYVFLAFDSNCLNQSINLIKSLYKYNDSLCCLCFVTHMQQEEVQTLLTINNNVVVIEYELLIPNNLIHMSSASLMRLFVPYLLNNHINNILYLDSDIICCKPFKKYYEDYKENTLSLAIDVQLNFSDIHIHSNGSKIYCNSGVILFNVPNYCRIMDINRLYELMISNISKYTYPDQDFLNVFYEKYISVFPICMNFIVPTLGDSSLYIKEKENIVFYHFAGAKPWKGMANKVTTSIFLKVIYDKEERKKNKTANCKKKN